MIKYWTCVWEGRGLVHVHLVARNARSRVLKRICAAIGSQCRSISSGVTWADFGRHEISLAAAFWTIAARGGVRQVQSRDNSAESTCCAHFASYL